MEQERIVATVSVDMAQVTANQDHEVIRLGGNWSINLATIEPPTPLKLRLVGNELGVPFVYEMDAYSADQIPWLTSRPLQKLSLSMVVDGEMVELEYYVCNVHKITCQTLS